MRAMLTLSQSRYSTARCVKKCSSSTPAKLAGGVHNMDHLWVKKAGLQLYLLSCVCQVW